MKDAIPVHVVEGLHELIHVGAHPVLGNIVAPPTYQLIDFHVLQAGVHTRAGSRHMLVCEESQPHASHCVFATRLCIAADSAAAAHIAAAGTTCAGILCCPALNLLP